MANPTKNAPAAPVASAKPGTKEPKAKKEKKEKAKRVDFPGLFVEKDGEKRRVKLAEYPANFDPKVHKPLRRGDFENESVFLLRKADEFEQRAKDLRNEATIAEKLGNQADRAKAKRLAAMQKKIAELEASLKESGVDVEAILKAAEANVADKTKTA